ncbi:hypothetical protein [Engelhardtia mirabilis]|uniref:DUF2500 domain-containing protein n=1 Tax=Engelhardtia mirabilis TaxID=2528011 RepID=A0A518BG29_9BACT|nr:hypothetical protein Pla133_10070 [Planctomycetes bacterium Pla133]QDV00267.1 hypothetical protein Pla86_10060 [Planctomycetes bacterium Pla86]
MSEQTATQNRKQTALMKRLARIHEHKDYPKALEHVPPTEEDLEAAARSTRRGAMLAVVAALVGALAVTREGLAGQVVFGAIAIAAAVFAARAFLAGGKQRSEVLAHGLERRAALVADRRSETTASWAGGRTTYYFQLEFDNGENGEFRYPGRGVQDDLLVKGNTGVAFLRGRTLIAWKNIKV